MNKSRPQEHYENYYNIADSEIWGDFKPRESFIEKRLLDFKINFWYVDCHEGILAELSNYAPFESVLEVGCSTGDFLIPISKAADNVYGVDIVDFSVVWKIMRRKWNINCRQLDLDNSNLPFEDKSFDLVMMLNTLEHVFRVYHAIKEISRVLIPNGIAVIIVPNIAYFKRRFGLILGKLPCTSVIAERDSVNSWDGQHLHYFTLKSLIKLVNRYGLYVEKVRCFGRFPKLRWLRPSLLGGELTIFVRKAKDRA